MSAAVCFVTVRRRSRERRWAGRGVGRRKTMQKHLLLVVKKQQQRARRKLLLRRPRNQEEEKEEKDGRRRAIDRPLSSIPLLVALVLVVSDFLVLLALVFHLLLVESSSSLILSPCGPAGRPPPLLLNSTTKSGKTTTALIAVWILDSALLCCAVLCRSSFRRTPAITRDDGPSLLPSSWNAWIVSGSLVQLGGGGRKEEEEEVRPAMRRTKEDEGRPADGRMRTSSLSSSLVVLVLVLGTFSSVAVSSISPRFPTTADSLNPWLAADGGLILRAVAGPGNSSPLNWIRPNPGSCAPKPAIPPCPSDRYCRLPSNNNNKTAIISSESSSSSLVCLPYLQQQQSVVVVVGEDDEEEQNPSSAECICGHPDGAKRIDALRKYHLQHCYHYSLWHVLSDTMREGIAISRQQCYAYVEAVQQLDNLAAHFVCQFEDIIRRYDCGQTFSSKSSCHQCKVFFFLFFVPNQNSSHY